MWPPSRSCRQRAAWHVAWPSAAPGIGGRAHRRSGHNDGAGCGERAVRPHRGDARRVKAGARRGNPWRHRGGRHRRDRLAAHPRRVATDRNHPRSVERRCHRAVRGVMVGPPPRPPLSWDCWQRAGLRAHHEQRLLGRCARVRLRDRGGPSGATIGGRLDARAVGDGIERPTTAGRGRRDRRGPASRRRSHPCGRRVLPAPGRADVRRLGGPRTRGLPWHGARFDCGSGDVLRGPATASLPSYATRVRDGMVEVCAR